MLVFSVRVSVRCYGRVLVLELILSVRAKARC